MSEFFSVNWSGAPFVLFGPAHLAALAIVVAINLVIVALRSRFTPSRRVQMRYTLAVILVVNEVGWHIWNYAVGRWTIQTMLPLHLCSVLVWGSAYMMFTKNYSIYEFLYFLGISGATQALLTPDAGEFGFPHYRAFQTIISHGAIVTAAIYMTVVEGYRPTWRSLVRVAVWANLYLAFVGVVNWAIGSNYMFVAHKPETASLIDVLGPWPWYILSLEAIGLAMCLILYLPFALKDRFSTTPKAASPAIPG